MTGLNHCLNSEILKLTLHSKSFPGAVPQNNPRELFCYHLFSEERGLRDVSAFCEGLKFFERIFEGNVFVLDAYLMPFSREIQELSKKMNMTCHSIASLNWSDSGVCFCSKEISTFAKIIFPHGGNDDEMVIRVLPFDENSLGPAIAQLPWLSRSPEVYFSHLPDFQGLIWFSYQRPLDFEFICSSPPTALKGILEEDKFQRIQFISFNEPAC